ncbi:MAG: hypothetical protein Q8868_12335 [Bacteroidota bacterium]|nr:hypothetical protein [Bacteroidota bacterium]
MAAKDTSSVKSAGSYHSFFAGTGFGSNMIYLGSTISHDQPYGYGTLAYGYKNELFTSVSAAHLSNYNPFIAFYIGALNYNHVFSSWFDISSGIYRYQVVSSLTDSLFNSFTYGELTLGVDWRLLYSKISIGGLVSEENQAYFQFRNSRYFQTPEIFNGKANISFDPYANLLFGNLVTVRTSTENTVVVSSPGRSWKKRKYGTTTYTSYSKHFGLMEADFGLPVAFNTDKMTIEAEADYILPVYKDPDIHGPKGFIFMLSGFFRIL